VDVGEVRQLLDEREAACQAECDRLQAEVERIGVLLAARQQELERLVTAREVVGELTVAYPAVAVVPVMGADAAAPGGDIEAFSKQVLAVLAERGRPVRCREVVAALGEDASVARHVERVRHRLKKLRAAGLVAETASGMFTLAGTPNG
jgi:predicted MarR family transcription regulator